MKVDYISVCAAHVFQRIGITQPSRKQMKGVEDLIRKLLIRSDMFADNRLTEREAACLLLLAQGYSRDQVANILHKSYHTVLIYIRNIKEKLNANNLLHAVFIALMPDIGELIK